MPDLSSPSDPGPDPYRGVVVVLLAMALLGTPGALAGVATVRWVPPPVNGKYNGFRITLAPPGAGQASTVYEDEDNRR